MSELQKALRDYLAMRRALGFKLRKHEKPLQDFVSVLEAEGATHITIALAVPWARQPKNAQPGWWAERLGMVRGFAQYLSGMDPRTEIPTPGLLPHSYRRPTPHIYTDDEVRRFIEAAKQLPPKSGLRRWTYSTLFGLLWVTGIRIGEARALNHEDVDLDQAVLTIRGTKFGKSRFVPLHASTRSALRRYARRRDQEFPNPRTKAFFVTIFGTRHSHAAVDRTFIQLSYRIGLRSPGDRTGPRIHDLRHSFAVKTLTGFYRADVDIDRKVHTLSVYLGHTAPSCTYWYLSAVPELMGLAQGRLEKKLGDLP